MEIAGIRFFYNNVVPLFTFPPKIYEVDSVFEINAPGSGIKIWLPDYEGISNSILEDFDLF